MADPAVACFSLDLHEFLTVQVHKRDCAISQLVFEAGFVENQFRVALMAGALSDHNVFGTEPQKTTSGSSYQLWMGVYWLLRHVFDEIGLQENGLSANVQKKLLKRGQQ